ncbi:transcription factor Opi1, partial [Eremomyces bilateralis CBS 781.70]
STTGSVNNTLNTISNLSMDDPDVRMAAEALSGLGNPDFFRGRTGSPHHSPPAVYSPNASSNATVDVDEASEPLLTLLTSSHPLLSSAITGSITAYATSKHYSPSFIRSQVERVERAVNSVGSPVVQTVGSVSRRTGVEGAVRKYLKDTAKARRKDGDADFNIPQIRNSSQASLASRSDHDRESLPPYDEEHRSPNYETLDPHPEHPSEKQMLAPPGQSERDRQPRHPQTWSTQLMMTTSGLGVALSDSSLTSLRYCLDLLATATERIASVMSALALLVGKFDPSSSSSQQQQQPPTNHSRSYSSHSAHDRVAADATQLAARLHSLTDDLFATLRHVTHAVSRYAGGALPENAGALVRRQLLSLPGRWQMAGEETGTTAGAQDGERATPRQGAGDEGAVRHATRVLAFGREALEMLSQVALVVEGTVRSAEAWLGSIGR